jgi:GTP cyclohydrolase IB
MVMLKTQPNSKVINLKTDNLNESLDWVGIDSMNLPIMYSLESFLNRTSAQMNVSVSLDKGEFKGIDMAELFFNSQEILADKELNFKTMNQLTEKLLSAHADRALSSKLELSFDIFLKKKTLRSEQVGIQAYPITLELINSADYKAAFLSFEILYASTCPCSEAASRRENLEKFEEFFANSSNPKNDFKDWYLNSKNAFAHPHAQKSLAKFNLEVDPDLNDPVDFANKLIVELEELIQTSVHAAVRNEDEAAFTTKMGENLIFIEDAAKKFKNYIKNKSHIKSSAVELIHNESIHPHNAKALFTT